ncbi:MAG TPA: rhomboid family intramembrane serine protease [Bacteroidia bacterium]|nr:rhomboid family intramembrane serine protease [Bacteroidia bacterium]
MATSISENIKRQFSASDTLQRLLIVNVAVFVIVRLVNSLSSLYMVPLLEFETVSNWVAVPASTVQLLKKPWTLLTYMFYHWDFMHILFNMLWLYWMGKIFQEYLGNKKLLNTYLLGGISGALVYILAYNIFPLFASSVGISYTLGASASVLAVSVATATLLPEYSIHLMFFGAVRLKWIAIVSILLDLINVSGSNAGGHIAHLGGALFGFIYIRQLQKGTDISAWLTKLIDLLTPGKKSKMKVSHSRKRSDEDFTASKRNKQERLDGILEKISKSGYGSLTTEEKDFLFNASKEK